MPVQHSNFFEPIGNDYWDGDNISFVNRPFLLEDAPIHFSRLKAYGFNTIRYVFTWEALEHTGPGVYDDDYISFTISVLKLLDQFGFYVFMDPHQDNVRIFILFLASYAYANSGLGTVEVVVRPCGRTMPWV